GRVERETAAVQAIVMTRQAVAIDQRAVRGSGRLLRLHGETEAAKRQHADDTAKYRSFPHVRQWARPRTAYAPDLEHSTAIAAAEALFARQIPADAADGFRRHAEVGREHGLRHPQHNRRIHPEKLEVAFLS